MSQNRNTVTFILKIVISTSGLKSLKILYIELLVESGSRRLAGVTNAGRMALWTTFLDNLVEASYVPSPRDPAQLTANQVEYPEWDNTAVSHSETCR